MENSQKVMQKIKQLKDKAEALVGKPDPIRYRDRIVGVVMYRDNTIIDVIRQIDEGPVA